MVLDLRGVRSATTREVRPDRCRAVHTPEGRVFRPDPSDAVDGSERDVRQRRPEYNGIHRGGLELAELHRGGQDVHVREYREVIAPGLRVDARQSHAAVSPELMESLPSKVKSCSA